MEVPVSFRFDCDVVKKPVLITGTDGVLESDNGVEMRAPGKRSCEVSPACGLMLGERGCPFTIQGER